MYLQLSRNNLECSSSVPHSSLITKFGLCLLFSPHRQCHSKSFFCHKNKLRRISTKRCIQVIQRFHQGNLLPLEKFFHNWKHFFATKFPFSTQQMLHLKSIVCLICIYLIQRGLSPEKMLSYLHEISAPGHLRDDTRPHWIHFFLVNEVR